MLEEERKQPRIIHLTSLFDRISEINLRNSYQILEDVINGNDITKGLIARLSKDFALNTSSFVGGTSQLIERNYEDTENLCDNLKIIDKQHDIPYMSLKSNILELTQEVRLRSDSKLFVGSEQEDKEVTRLDVKKERDSSENMMRRVEEESYLSLWDKEKLNNRETDRREEIKREYGKRYQEKEQEKLSAESEADDEEESDDGLLEKEFGRSHQKEKVVARFSNPSTIVKTGYPVESRLWKEVISKRKAPGTQSEVESIQQQGKRMRMTAA